MDTILNDQSKKSSTSHLFDLGDDNFDFKPMTEGLGFNDNSIYNGKDLKVSGFKNVEIIDLPVRSKEELLSQMSSRALPKSQQVIDKSSLQSVYQSTQKQSTKEKTKRARLTEASQLQKLLAWTVDIFIITFIFLIMGFATKTILSVSWRELIQISSSLDLKVISLMLFLTIYMIYFTILDLGTTVGKDLLSIRVKKSRGKVSIIDTFFRTFLTMFSFFTFGLASALDFQGKLTDTKVIKDL